MSAANRTASPTRSRVCALTTAHRATDIRIFEKQCRSLAESGWEVVLVAPHPRDEEIDRVRIAGVPRRASRTGRFTRTLWDVYRRGLRENATIYHLHDPELLLPGLLLRARGKLVIYDAHEDFPGGLRDREWLPRPLRYIASVTFAAFEKLAARRMSACVTVNDEIAARLCSANARTTVIRNYPRLAEFAHVGSHGADHFSSGLLVSFGGISAARSTLELVQAMGALTARCPARLLLGGDVESDELFSDCQQLPGWSRVDYRGQLSREEMTVALASATAALVMFNPHCNHYNPGSNRLFESMAAGLPVITPNFPRWRALVEGHGIGRVADPTDPNDIARAVQHVLSHPDEAAAMGRRGRDLVFREYNWEREQGELICLYHGLVDTDAAGPLMELS